MRWLRRFIDWLFPRPDITVRQGQSVVLKEGRFDWVVVDGGTLSGSGEVIRRLDIISGTVGQEESQPVWPVLPPVQPLYPTLPWTPSGPIWQYDPNPHPTYGVTA